MIIENFKLIDYLNQAPEVIENYLIALRYVKGSETEQKIFNMKLKEVEMIRQNINSVNDIDLIKIVAAVQKLDEKEVLDITIIDFFKLLNGIKEQLNIIIKAEENAFAPHEINMKWEQVEGSQRMSKFGIYNTLESLSGGDALKYKEYMEMEYSEIFTILLMRKTAADIQSDMSKIKNK